MAKNFEIVNILKKSKPYKYVYAANSKQQNDLVAIKVIDLDHNELSNEANYTNELLRIINEISRLKQLRHQNILTLINCFTLNTKLYLVYPFMTYGSCKDILESKQQHNVNDSFNEQSLQLISKSILQAIDYLHSKHIIHRLICPKNIFITYNGNCLLGGFKYSVSLIEQGNLNKKLHDYPSNTKDYLNYLSPEMLQQNLLGYNTKSDIYSFGVTLCELANGANPFVGCEKTQMLLEKLVGADIGLWDCTILNDESKINAIEVCASENPQIIDAIKNKHYSEYFRNFVDLCVTKNYQVRLNASQLLQHPVFKKPIRRSLIDLLQPIHSLNEKLSKSKFTFVEEDDGSSRFRDKTAKNQLWNFD